MVRRTALSGVILGLCSLAGSLSLAQAQQPSSEPPTVIISIYHVAPGKHLEFLKYMADGDAIDKEAGLTAAQWFAHENGDSWDFLSITPLRTEAEDKKTEELTKAKGRKTGFAAALEFRQFITSHTDTHAIGPQTVTALLEAAGAK